MSETVKRTCWCYIMGKSVTIDGDIVGHRQADLLKVKNCVVEGCVRRVAADCLIGKIIEGKWAC